MDIKTADILVYAHWSGMTEPKYIGRLSADFGAATRLFSFEYNEQWISSREQLLLDPDLGWFSGPQFPVNKANFGVFLDSMPDAWGRTLMQRRQAQRDRETGKSRETLNDMDYLLGVFDECRMGALRFKLDHAGPFLDTDSGTNIPPFTSLKELQKAVKVIEGEIEDKNINDWIKMLIAPGASLGGIRPKANFYNQDGNMWIAKFPSRIDNIDKAAWEYLAFRLSKTLGINMAQSVLTYISGNYKTFLTMRFDRIKKERIHFASAMTMTGFSEQELKEKQPGYLDIAEFIRFSGANVKEDLKQLWTRMVFNIAISNTDDHLKNHGFLLTGKGWVLAPAFDVNPSVDNAGLSLNIDETSNALDFNLAKDVGKYFLLNNDEMKGIITKVKKAVRKWRTLALEIGISGKDQDIMAPAFRC